MREGMIAFADRHLEPYIIRGDELIPDFAPSATVATTGIGTPSR